MQFETAIDRAINGVTTLRVIRGGSIEIANAPDRKLLDAALLSNNGRFSGNSAASRTLRQQKRDDNRDEPLLLSLYAWGLGVAACIPRVTFAHSGFRLQP